MSRGHDLRTLADLGDTHLGRTITVRGLTGTLTGIVPVGHTIGLVLVIGGRRAFTDAYPADEHVEITQRHPDPADLCVWCDANKHERCRGADNCACPCNNREETRP